MARSDDDAELSTLPDPRSRATSPAIDAEDSPVMDTAHDELTTLSTKLINAINHQTNLDNTLSSTRQELEQARELIRKHEATIESQREMLVGHVWIRRQTVEHEKKELLQRIATEKKARAEAEQEKRKIEGEVEALTASLFLEANNMVANAKADAMKQQETLEKKNELLRAHLADTEALLWSQQQQLAELKQVMEQMSAEHDDRTNLTAPSSPGLSKFDSRDDMRFLGEGPLVSPLTEPVSPAYPTSYSNLIQPVLRTDIATYEDFKLLTKVGRNRAGSRVSSGSISGAPLAGGTSSSAHPSNASTSSLAPTGIPASATPQTPQTPPSYLGSPTAGGRSDGAALKDTKFFKRLLVEDIEPTLRLDSAQGLKWLGRRNVLGAIVEGHLVVEPALKTSQLNPCSLCGESRSDEQHLRTHGFCTSDSESAQRYPLCGYCLGRVRSTCDFLGFLRILKDGYWRTDDADSEKAAWEESVRLREQMFWARIGGGVVPAGQLVADGEKNSRPSQDDSSVQAGPESRTPAIPQATLDELAPLVEEIEVEPVTPPAGSVRNSAQPLDVRVGGSPEKEAKRLSITIPSNT
jgi:Rab guanine nucleotide exchange factor SEC2